ncbi:uncharacterized protein [Aquarana catesbeiana]|uniref:uncharacterized protein isoform X3 n=1 Tax=Aquarana catesbeiana TaxID=8400 RepID=UPI003CC96384
MTARMRMEEDRSHMAKKILNLTLEIIYLLTGERFPSVEFGGQVTITVPSPPFLTPCKKNEKKILEVTKKIIGLLTGEECLDGHKDLYKDVMMDNQPPLTSPDGSSNGNPPERCHGDNNIVVKEEYKEDDEEYGVMKELSEGRKDMMEPPNSRNPPERSPRPLYSRDSTQEDHTIPHHHQSGNPKVSKVEVKSEEEEDEIKEEDEDDDGVMEQSGISKGHKYLYQDTVVVTSINRNPPERSPLYSRDSTEEGHTIPHHHLGENVENYNIVVKDEYDEEYGEMDEFLGGHKDMMDSLNTRNPPERRPHPLYSWDSTQEDQDSEDEDHSSKIEENREKNQKSSPNNPSYKEEETLPEPSADGCDVGNSSEGSQMSSADYDGEDNGIPADSQNEKPFLCSECGQSFKWKTSLERHMRVHTGETFPCEECGKRFRQKDRLKAHLRIHTGEKLHICTECGKCFVWKDSLIRHLRIHTGEKPFSCLDCGKCFTQKSNLWSHQKVHIEKSSMSFSECGNSLDYTSELPIHQRAQASKMLSCSECGKLCVSKSELTIHQRSHTGEMPFLCPECGKCFSRQGSLTSHMKMHTGDKPFSCTMCGKSYGRKSELGIHLNGHTGQHRFSCSECGKGFSHKEKFRRHQRTHTGERPYTCSECGKGYQQNSHLLEHLRRHTGVCPYPCLVCGKSFPLQSALDKHQIRHTGERPASNKSNADKGRLRRQRKKSHAGQRSLS